MNTGQVGRGSKIKLPLSEVLKLETRLPLELIEINENLLADIRENGIKEPIEIRIREDNSLIIWDGLNRLAIAVKLNLEIIPAIFTRK